MEEGSPSVTFVKPPFFSLSHDEDKALSPLPLFFVCAVPIYCGGVKKGATEIGIMLEK